MPTWADAIAIATAWPETEESTSYGTPALKVRGKLLARQRGDAENRTVVICELSEKDDPATDARYTLNCEEPANYRVSRDEPRPMRVLKPVSVPSMIVRGRP
jgi:hypothetical protein